MALTRLARQANNPLVGFPPAVGLTNVVPYDRRFDGRAARVTSLVRADPLAISRILGNLLDNATTHSPPAAPIRLIVAREDRQVVLAVHDQGPGVPSDQREPRGTPAEGAPVVPARALS
jgi:signal transduction histidine kinase